MEESMDNQPRENLRQEILRGRVVEEVYRGLVIDCDGRLTFLPQSQVVEDIDGDLSGFIGQEIDVVPLNMPPRLVRGYGELPVVSHKVAAVEEDHEAARHIQEGDIFEATVSRVSKEFVSVNILTSIEAFLPKHLISWEFVENAAKCVRVGQKFNVMVMKVKTGQQGNIKRIVVSRCHTTPSPWVEFAKTAKEGDVVTGKITSKTNFGLFVGLPSGVTGMVHISELSYNHKPSTEEYSVGESVTAKIVSIDWEKRRMQMSMKALKEDPWQGDIELRYAIGQLVAGPIVHMNRVGIYIQLEEGVTGLIPKARLREKYHDFRQQHQPKDLISAAVVEIFKDTRRIILTNKITIEDA